MATVVKKYASRQYILELDSDLILTVTDQINKLTIIDAVTYSNGQIITFDDIDGIYKFVFSNGTEIHVYDLEDVSACLGKMSDYIMCNVSRECCDPISIEDKKILAYYNQEYNKAVLLLTELLVNVFPDIFEPVKLGETKTTKESIDIYEQLMVVIERCGCTDVNDLLNSDCNDN